MSPARTVVDWRVLGAAGLIATLLHAWGMVERSASGATQPLPRELALAALHLAMVGCVVAATLLADRAADRGARPLAAYGSALLLGSAAAAGLQFAIHRWTNWPNDLGMGMQAALDPARVGKVFLDFVLWGATFVWVYAALREKWRTAARMQAVQLEREEIRRRAMQTQLLALQARVEPRFLFGTLGRVRHLYATEPERAGQMLDDLVDYLRAALPQLRESSSTLGQELRLVAAYLSIRQEAVATDLTPESLGFAMPPMVLLPLVAGLRDGVGPATAPMTISASVHDASLQVSVTDPCDAGDGIETLAQDIRERLAALHGGQSSLIVERPAGRSTRIAISLPSAPSAADGTARAA